MMVLVAYCTPDASNPPQNNTIIILSITSSTNTSTAPNALFTPFCKSAPRLILFTFTRALEHWQKISEESGTCWCHVFRPLESFTFDLIEINQLFKERREALDLLLTVRFGISIVCCFLVPFEEHKWVMASRE